MKSVLKWGLAAIASVIIVFLILYLFTLLIGPLKTGLTSLLSGYIRERSSVQQPEPEPYPEEVCNIYISGKVTRNDGLPVINAEVKIYNAGLYHAGELRFTDSNGEFSYNELGTDTCDKENYFLLIKKNGFQPYFKVAVPDEVVNISLTSLYYF